MNRSNCWWIVWRRPVIQRHHPTSSSSPSSSLSNIVIIIVIVINFCWIVHSGKSASSHPTTYPPPTTSSKLYESSNDSNIPQRGSPPTLILHQKAWILYSYSPPNCMISFWHILRALGLFVSQFEWHKRMNMKCQVFYDIANKPPQPAEVCGQSVTSQAQSIIRQHRNVTTRYFF